MHPRNPYRSPPDFLALAKAYPPLLPHVITTASGAIIDFRDEASQRRLTEAILYRDFDIKIQLPSGRLCPPVPNRLNYVLWLEDLVQAVALATLSGEPPRPVRGLDIGTGASAIYPLLACQLHTDWMFVATDIDPLSLKYACENVKSNGLQERISIFSAAPNGPILLPLAQTDVKYDFTMCNPPFYGSHEEMLQSAEAKESEPNAVCTGADVEMIAPGGEPAFVGRMVEESLELEGRCRWFTSMVGKMSSLTHVVRLLREHNVDNYAVTELVQGQTRRWVIAWSFEQVHLPDSIARLSHPALQNIMPARNTLQRRLPRGHSSTRLKHTLSSVLHSVDGLALSSLTSNSSGRNVDILVSATGNTWSRAARRKKYSAMQVEEGGPADVQLVCHICCACTPHDMETGAESSDLTFNWVRGKDRSLFESFASHVGRKVVTALSSDSGRA